MKLAVDDSKLTEAHCYLGFNDVLRKRAAEAREHFTWVAEKGVSGFIEHYVSNAEMKRLPVAAGQ